MLLLRYHTLKYIANRLPLLMLDEVDGVSKAMSMSILDEADGVSKGMPILDEVDGFPKGDTGNRLVLAVITIFSILVHIKTRIVV